MHRRVPIPASPDFDRLAEGAQFRDRVAVVVKASPDAIFKALREVALRDMKLAWALGEIRYLPSRLDGHMTAVDSTRPFLPLLIEGGTLVLRDDSPHELITGSAAQLHRVNQAPRQFTTRETFDTFADPDHEKLFMSIRVAPTGRPQEHWLVLEHATRARTRSRTVRASAAEKSQPLPGDTLITEPLDSLTHAITIDRAARDVWPWLAQMGAGSRAGWYSYDVLDNGRQRSAERIIPELQQLTPGMICPALRSTRAAAFGLPDCRRLVLWSDDWRFRDLKGSAQL